MLSTVCSFTLLLFVVVYVRASKQGKGRADADADAVEAQISALLKEFDADIDDPEAMDFRDSESKTSSIEAKSAYAMACAFCVQTGTNVEQYAAAARRQGKEQKLAGKINDHGVDGIANLLMENCKNETSSLSEEHKMTEEQMLNMCNKVFRILVPPMIASTNAGLALGDFCVKVKACTTQLFDQHRAHDAKTVSLAAGSTNEVIDDNLDKFETHLDRELPKAIRLVATNDTLFGYKLSKPALTGLIKDTMRIFRKSKVYAGLIEDLKAGKAIEWDGASLETNIKEAMLALYVDQEIPMAISNITKNNTLYGCSLTEPEYTSLKKATAVAFKKTASYKEIIENLYKQVDAKLDNSVLVPAVHEIVKKRLDAGKLKNCTRIAEEEARIAEEEEKKYAQYWQDYTEDDMETDKPPHTEEL